MLAYTIANRKTGETVSCNTIKPIISTIKGWVYNDNDLRVSQLQVINAKDWKAVSWFHKTLLDNKKQECDCCGNLVKQKDLEFYEDKHGVLTLVLCDGCK